jgi:hypothetical protein
MIDVRSNPIAVLLSAGLLVLAGCDLAPPGYDPPGEDHEVSGQVLWGDSFFREDPSLPIPPNRDDCDTEGLNLHASRLRGTQREIIDRGGSTGPSSGYPFGSGTDIALDRSARQAYWPVHTELSPPCGPEKSAWQIKRVSLSNSRAEAVRETENSTIPVLAVSGGRLAWVETTEETSVILEAPLPAGEGSLQPDTAYVTEGEIEALEAGPDGEAIYWNTEDNQLFRTRFGDGTTRLSGSFSGEVEAIGGRPARIYWAASRSSAPALRSVALDGTDARQDGTLPAETTAMTIGPRGEKVIVGTEGEEEGIWAGSLSDPQASEFDKCVGEGKSGNRHREDFQTPRSLAVLYDTPR